MMPKSQQLLPPAAGRVRDRVLDPIMNGWSPNALKVLEFVGRSDVPVAAGADRPLRREAFVAEYVHGESGLDGPALPPPVAATVEQHAVDFIAELVLGSADPVTLVPTGPLTSLPFNVLVTKPPKTAIPAKLADYPTRFRIGATGTLRGDPYRILGRVRFQDDESYWDEWYLELHNGEIAWLEEDEGQYILSRKQQLTSRVPSFDDARVGSTITVNGELVINSGTVQNTNVAVKVANLQNATNIVNNDIPQNGVTTSLSVEPASHGATVRPILFT